MTRVDWPDYFLSIAAMVATRSTCPRLAVGAVLTLENRILATGYNGAPAGEPHCTDIGCLLVACDTHGQHCKRANHAEDNILEQLFWLEDTMKGTLYTQPTILYCTHKPCNLCTLRLARHGITNLVWAQDYKGVPCDPTPH